MPSRSLSLILLCYIVGAAALASFFPPVNGDEAGNAVHGYNLFHGQGSRYSLYDDVFAPSIYTLRDAAPEISKVFYNVYIGTWMKAFGKSLWHVRLSSVFAGALVLILFYMLGNELRGPPLGLVMAGICALNPIFLVASALLRPEMALLLGATFLLWLSVKIPPDFHWKSYLLGCLAGALMSVHQNAAPFYLGLLATSIGDKRGKTAAKEWLFSSLGFGTGFILILCLFDLKKFLLTQNLFYYHFYRPPILIFPWHPWDWVRDTIAGLFSGHTYYFHSDRVAGWRPVVVIFWTTAMAVLVFEAISFRGGKKSIPWQRKFLFGLTAVFVGMCLLLRRKEAVYFTLLFPFLIPMVGDAIISSRRMAWALAGGIIAPFFLFICFAFRYTQRCLPYHQMIQSAWSHVGKPELKVIAPAVLWFDWPTTEFRDIGALHFSHLFTGTKDLREWMDPWKPDILITDQQCEHIFLGEGAARKSFDQILGFPVEYLGRVDTGLVMGPLIIYRLHWTLFSDGQKKDATVFTLKRVS
jgi:hypothetical protein